jgi:hypothetical protein
VVSKDGAAVNLSYANGTTMLVPGTPYKCAAVYIPSISMELYINGISNALNTTSIQSAIYDSTSSELWIGGLLSTSYTLDGRIGNVQIWNRALTATEIGKLNSDPYGTPNNPRLI